MRTAIAALLLFASGAAFAASSPAKSKARREPKPELAASPPAAQGLPLLAPTTEPLTADLVTARFEDFDNRINTLAADFGQAVTWEESGVRQAIEGSLEFHKPALLRIEHRKPERQTIVADGTWLWVWRRDNNQVVQTKLEDWKKSEPVAQGLLDFGNYAKLLKTYQVSIATVSAPGADGHRSFEVVLRPKDQPGRFSLILRMTTADFFPAQTELKVGGVRVVTTFRGVRYNPELPEEHFRFTPPPDADVFKNFKPPRSE